MSIEPARDEYIVAGNLTFHYVQWGTQGSPIIFIHGLTGTTISTFMLSTMCAIKVMDLSSPKPIGREYLRIIVTIVLCINHKNFGRM